MKLGLITEVTNSSYRLLNVQYRLGTMPRALYTFPYVNPNCDSLREICPHFTEGRKLITGQQDLNSELEEHDRVQVDQVWGISKRTRHGSNDRHKISVSRRPAWSTQ